MKLYAIFLSLLLVAGAEAQTTEFTYQGSLSTSGMPANGSYDFEFLLYDSLAGGAQQGSTLTRNGVTVSNGIFAVTLDFGDQFPGASRFLEIRTRVAGGGGHTILAPRHAFNSTPYAVKSVSADNATTASNALQLGGVAASHYVITTDPRMTDERTPTAGSSNYIQNQNAGAQTASNFNISGSGTAGGTLSSNIVNSATQYNIGGNRVLSVGGEGNVFAGVGSGADNTTGGFNSFFGISAGRSNTTGGSNSFFGRDAGFRNTTGFNNSFFGLFAGFSNTTGGFNSFFGTGAGYNNTTGDNNSFFGRNAGFSNETGGFNSFFGTSAGSNNTTGADNSFFGRSAGISNTTGGNNSFFGVSAGTDNTTGVNNSIFGLLAGLRNTTGGDNSFFGLGAGSDNTTGSNNTIIGRGANVSVGNLTFATAIGAQAVVTASSRVQIGRITLDTVAIGAFASPATSTAACVNAQGVFVSCSASSLRYKDNVRPFRSGLDLVSRLRPVAFTWKDDGGTEIGLVAEDVAAVDPILSVYDPAGKVDGVKYTQLTLVLINAVNEQQAMIEAQAAEIKESVSENARLRSKVDTHERRFEQQKAEIDGLKALVCAANPAAGLCRARKEK